MSAALRAKSGSDGCGRLSGRMEMDRWASSTIDRGPGGAAKGAARMGGGVAGARAPAVELGMAFRGLVGANASSSAPPSMGAYRAGDPGDMAGGVVPSPVGLSLCYRARRPLGHGTRTGAPAECT